MKFLKKHIWWFVAAGVVLYFFAPARADDRGSAPAPVPNFIPGGSGHPGSGVTGIFM